MRKRVYASSFIHTKITWKCSSCSAENEADQNLTFSSNSSHSPTWERITHAAAKSAIQNRAEAVQQLSHVDSGKRYDKLKLKCKCKKCGYREPWAEIFSLEFALISWLISSATVILGLMVLGPAILALSYNFESAWKLLLEDPMLFYFGASLLGLIILHAGNRYRISKLHAQIRNLPEASLPTFFQQENSLSKSPATPSETPTPRMAEKALEAYTEEKFKALPAWKRVELMHQNRKKAE